MRQDAEARMQRGAQGVRPVSPPARRSRWPLVALAGGPETALEMDFRRDPQGSSPSTRFGLKGPDHTHICSARAEREPLEKNSLKKQDVGQAEGEAAS